MTARMTKFFTFNGNTEIAQLNNQLTIVKSIIKSHKENFLNSEDYPNQKVLESFCI